MQALFARVVAILLALQPWAFGMFAAPRVKSSTSSLSSPTRDQTVLETAKSTSQLPSATKDMAVAPTIINSTQAPKYQALVYFFQTTTEAPQKCLLARYGRWLE